MTKIGIKDASLMVKSAMDRLEAAAEGKKTVKIDDIKDKDLRALAEAATTGAGDRVSLSKLRDTLKTIGTELTNVDQKQHGGDGDGKLDYREAAKLSPLAMRMLDWASDGIEMAGEKDAVMWVQDKDINEVARQALAEIRTELPKGRKPVKLADAKGNPFLEQLIRAAAQRISDEGPTVTRRVRVSSGCGGGSRTVTGTEPKYSPADILAQGVSRAKLREIVTDAKNYLANDVTWSSPLEGNASIGNQRWAVEDYAGGANDDYGPGTGDAAIALFERMAKDAEKGNMRPSQDDLAGIERRAVSSGC